MLKIPDKDHERLAGYVARLEAMIPEIDDHVKEANDQIADIVADVEDRVSKFNDIVLKADKIREKYAKKIVVYDESQTARWQKSEVGMAYRSWRWQWSDSLYLAEVSQDTEVYVDDLESAIDQIRDLTASPGEHS